MQVVFFLTNRIFFNTDTNRKLPFLSMNFLLCHNENQKIYHLQTQTFQTFQTIIHKKYLIHSCSTLLNFRLELTPWTNRPRD